MRPERACNRLQSGRKLDLLTRLPDVWTDADLAVGLSRTHHGGRPLGQLRGRHQAVISLEDGNLPLGPGRLGAPAVRPRMRALQPHRLRLVCDGFPPPVESVLQGRQAQVVLIGVPE